MHAYKLRERERERVYTKEKNFNTVEEFLIFYRLQA